MTGADVPAAAREAMVAAQAAWFAMNGIDPETASMHDGFLAGWAAALQWAAQQEIPTGIIRFEGGQLDEATIREFAERWKAAWREGGGTDG